ncbi:MAG: CPBP family intramembrane metalloprotease [Deltaproteobacteria bacterium]|nr:CPBP family intramembrane metalloprotease [Deltaproteobacteria bacterium]
MSLNSEPISQRQALILKPKTSFLFLLMVLLMYLVSGVFLQPSLGMMGVFINQIGFILFPCILICYHQDYFLDDWPLWKKPDALSVWITLGLTLLFSVLIDQAISFQEKKWPLPKNIQLFFDEITHIQNVYDGILKTLVLCLTPAFCEEILFRGLLQTSWVARFGKKVGILITALAFAIAHGNPWYLHLYFILGIFLGILLEWRRSLWLPILAHFLNNVLTLFS